MEWVAVVGFVAQRQVLDGRSRGDRVFVTIGTNETWWWSPPGRCTQNVTRAGPRELTGNETRSRIESIAASEHESDVGGKACSSCGRSDDRLAAGQLALQGEHGVGCVEVAAKDRCGTPRQWAATPAARGDEGIAAGIGRRRRSRSEGRPSSARIPAPPTQSAPAKRKSKWRLSSGSFIVPVRRRCYFSLQSAPSLLQFISLSARVQPAPPQAPLLQQPYCLHPFSFPQSRRSNQRVW
ncbi:uncharacterized protein LAESUDRAFT_352422 [Laetiporus sulphureus 93-53]|uniref:Uncharacterized protein n=1 Tax=Laetiporus sulphureus 93-53 TaxID=1314785 RepID=A0A165GUV2_9APHY|nr:uncharacterized protein LAESUDRAFT_352422 [Laetiporus sulphureus 93-53]KZT10844.1 hypothetical protein LAESUDRAFT_352422 [Laetiporus sulphureus 93-53]